MHHDVVVRAAADLHHPRRRQLDARGGLAVDAGQRRVRVDVAPAAERQRSAERRARRRRTAARWRRLGDRLELEPEHRPVLRVADVDHARAVDVEPGDPLGARVGAVPAALVLEHPGPAGHVEHRVVPGDPRVGHRDVGAFVAADPVLGARFEPMRGAHRADQQRRCATRTMRHLNPHCRIPLPIDRQAPGSLHTHLVKSLGLRGVIRNLVNYNYSATFLRARRHLSILIFGDSRRPDGEPTMSYEPTQPMRPPSTLSTVPVAGDQDTETQDDSGQGSAPEGSVSQATVPRAVLGQGNVPAPAGDAAPQVDTAQADAAAGRHRASRHRRDRHSAGRHAAGATTRSGRRTAGRHRPDRHGAGRHPRGRRPPQVDTRSGRRAAGRQRSGRHSAGRQRSGRRSASRRRSGDARKPTAARATPGRQPHQPAQGDWGQRQD